MLETEPIDGEPCRFRTCYPTTLWPIRLAEAALTRPPFPVPATRHTAAAASVLRLVLEHRNQAASFAGLELGSLRFFLKGQPQHAYKLYELILNHTLGVAVAASSDDPAPVLLGPVCLRPVGFERDEGVLPYTARSLSGYRLLTETFAYPQKFLFFDLAGLDRRVTARLGNRMEVFLYLDREAPDLEHLSDDHFRLGCTPVVNLYPKRAEPILLTHADFEYRVAPDARRPRSHEVYSIDRVTASSSAGESAEYRSFFSVRHAQAAEDAGVFWHAARRAGEAADGRADAGTEVFLSLVDLNRDPAATADWTVDVETTCLNRDLPARLPFGGGQPRLQLTDGDALVSAVSCVTAPTPTLRPAQRRGALWRLVSHLSLNHLSLVNDGKADAPARDPQTLRFRRLAADAPDDRRHRRGRQPPRRLPPRRGRRPGRRGDADLRRRALLRRRPLPLCVRAGTLFIALLLRKLVYKAHRPHQGAGGRSAPMAAADGRTSSGLIGKLQREPYRFEFFQAVRLLERLARGRASAPVGGDEPPEREAVRFRAAPSLGFAPAAVGQVRSAPGGADAAPEMAVSFLGLTGPSGALPHHYTTLLLRRARDKDHALCEFLDLFNHRAVSLFHRAWEKYRLPAAYERAALDAAEDNPDPVTQGLYCLVGLGFPGLRGRQQVGDEAFLYYGGHFSRDTRPASALEEILEDYFHMPARLQQFEGRWLPLEAEDRSYLAPSGEAGGMNCRLGEDFIVGERVWDAQSKFRIRVGPLSYAEFRRLTPDGDGLRPLCELTRSYVGAELSFDVQAVLAAGQAPGCRLGGDGAQLGWNSWVFAAEAPAEADDAVFALDDL